MSIKFVKLNPEAVIPKIGSEQSAGYDLQLIGFKKKVGRVYYFKTGLAIEPPLGYHSEIMPRSSISKTEWTLANSVGLIDQDYRGELIVALRWNGEEIITPQPDDDDCIDSNISSLSEMRRAIEELYKKPIVQLVFRKTVFVQFDQVKTLEKTRRGDGGFGSTDKK